MARVWRRGAAELIVGCLVLDLSLLACQVYGAGTAGSSRGPVIWWALELLLLWRIWRGGSWSWTILVVLNAWALAWFLLAFVWPWGLPEAGLMAIAATQLALLLSPAIRGNLRV